MLNNDKDTKLHSIINKFNNLSQFIINKIKEFKVKMLTKLLASMFNPQTQNFQELKKIWDKN